MARQIVNDKWSKEIARTAGFTAILFVVLLACVMLISSMILLGVGYPQSDILGVITLPSVIFSFIVMPLFLNQVYELAKNGRKQKRRNKSSTKK